MKNIYARQMRAFLFFGTLTLFSFDGFAQVGINTTEPTTMLDINGALSLREGSSINLTINNVDVSLGNTPHSLYRIVGPIGDFSIDGIVKVADSDGQLVTFINTTNFTMTLKSNSSGDDNKIVCPSDADFTLTGVNSSVTLQYNKALTKWIVTGYGDAGGYGRDIYKKIGTSDINTNSASFGDMGTDMKITFTPKHSVVYVNFSASGTMDKGVNFDSNAYANFQLVKENTPIVGTTTLASAGTSNKNFIYISDFPFVETFEASSPTLSSWSIKDYVFLQEPWELKNGSSGIINSAHGGSQNLSFDGPLARTNALSPVLDLSSITAPQLTFWYAQPRKYISFPLFAYYNNYLRVYYRISYADDWVLLQEYKVYTNTWKKITLPLPFPSKTYQIAFEAEGRGGYANVVDDVSINGTGGSSGILDTAWNAGFTMYPVSVTPGVQTTIKVQWLRDGKLPRTLRNNVTTDRDRSHRNLTILD